MRNNDYFYTLAIRSVAHMLSCSGACSHKKVLKEWCNLVHFNVYTVITLIVHAPI